MVRWFRYLFAALAWLFLLGVVVQTFYAGIGFFGGGDFEAHVTLGWSLHLAPILVLVAAALGRVGRTALLWTAALVVDVFIQPILALFRDMPAVAALHPVNALLVFAISIIVARQAWTLARTADVPPEPERPAEAAA